MDTPRFVVVGHAVRDLADDDWRLGGTVTYAALQAQRLNVCSAIVTRTGGEIPFADLLPAIDITDHRDDHSTCFENVYQDGHRRQHAPLRASPLTSEDIPDCARRAEVVLLGPVCGEVPPGMGLLFPNSLVGASAQGWLREIGPDNLVVPRIWDGAPFWEGCRVLFVSDEDLGDQQGHQLERWTREVPVVALTMAHRGARIHEGGRWRHIDAFPEIEVDPTGAGDVFAAAFLVRLWETGDVSEAARFAAAASSISVGGLGIAAVPTREQVEERLVGYPEIRLR